MASESEELAQQIGEFATGRLKKSSLGMTYILKEQGGVRIAENETLKLSTETQLRVTNLLGITELCSQLRRSLFEKASEGSIVDSSRSAPEPRSISNQDEFVRQLLGQNPRLINKLAEISSKAQVFIDVLDKQPNDSSHDIKPEVQTWANTIDEIARALCSSETELAHYQALIQNNVAQLNIPSQRTSVASNGETEEISVASYASRLDKLIQKPRGMALISSYLKPNQGETLADDVIDEYLETAFTLNAVRVLDRIQRPLGLNVKYSKLISCLKKEEVDFAYTKIIQDNDLAKDYSSLKSDIAKVRASALSDDEKKQSILELNNAFKEKCRPIIEKSFDQNTDQDEVVDLVRTKEWIVDLRRRAMEIAASTVSNEEKKQQLVDLDNVMRS